MASLRNKPTSINDRAWSDYAKMTREEFSTAYLQSDDNSIEVISEAVLGVVPYLGTLITVGGVMSNFSSKQKNKLINEINRKFVEDTSISYCEISLEFKGYRKGSQGWFWLATGNYRLRFS